MPHTVYSHGPSSVAFGMGLSLELIGMVPMKPSARLFNCARCHRQVMICPHCDRGQVYCAAECSGLARHDSLRRAARRYRTTRRARHANAQRQRRYRQRQRQQQRVEEKVTHQGSPLSQRGVVLTHRSDRGIEREHEHSTTSIRCHFCQCECSPFLRYDFVRYASKRRQEP